VGSVGGQYEACQNQKKVNFPAVALPPTVEKKRKRTWREVSKRVEFRHNRARPGGFLAIKQGGEIKKQNL